MVVAAIVAAVVAELNPRGVETYLASITDVGIFLVFSKICRAFSTSRRAWPWGCLTTSNKKRKMWWRNEGWG